MDTMLCLLGKRAFPPGANVCLLAHLSMIVHCHKEFSGLGWVQYDAAFRRQAAITQDLNWGRVNPTLYSICFAGQARHLTR